MSQHTYLRAYMAGVVVPTLAFVIVVTVFSVARYVYGFPLALERVLIFPMTAVPNLWGLWNMLFVASQARTRLSVGLHGALLPFLLAPLGILLTRSLDFQVPGYSPHIFLIIAPVGLIAYYLLWKYVVGFLNAVLGIA